jgi:predicted RNA-binding Zn-ribbon protein involved in translation (DUF1610 family)
VTPHADTERERRAIDQCSWCKGLGGRHWPDCRPPVPRQSSHACPTCGGTLVRCQSCHATFDTQESR